MSTKAIVWTLVVVVVLIGIGWYFWDAMGTAPVTAPTSQNASASQATNASTSTGQNAALSSGASNQDLSSDLSQIDTQTQAANTDSASVDQSFNDQPIPQAQ